MHCKPDSKRQSKEMACIGNFVRLIHLHERELTSCYAAAGSRCSGESNTVNIKKYKNVLMHFMLSVFVIIPTDFK